MIYSVFFLYIKIVAICLSSIILDKDIGWAVGGAYKIFKTIDGGETWNMTTEENSNTLYSVFFL